jgi:hypothetical protein
MDEQEHKDNYSYDVAISYAGEDRRYADALAQALRHRKLNVFYDRYEKSDLWGKNLYDHLSDVYQNKAHYCVILLSKHYASKQWTKHERQSAQARAFRENEEYILPVRLDDTQIPSIPSTTAYLRCPPETEETIANAIVEKLSKGLPKKPQEDSKESRKYRPPFLPVKTKQLVKYILFLALALALILIGSSALFRYPVNFTRGSIASPSLTATARAEFATLSQSKPTLSASSTVTGQETPTLTTCQSTALANSPRTSIGSLPSPYASYQGKLVLDDSMCIPAAHWDVFTDRSPNSPPTCIFTKSAYYVSTGKDAHLCGYSLSPSQGFQNFVYQIRITFLNDQTCGGIAFRQHPSSTVKVVMDYYDFLICTDQTYKLEVNNIDYPFSQVLENNGNTTIHQGIGQSNIIAVVARGTTLDLYINGQKIDSISDSSFSIGKIGVIAINLIGADTTTKQVAFNDAKLWTL